MLSSASKPIIGQMRHGLRTVVNLVAVVTAAQLMSYM